MPEWLPHWTRPAVICALAVNHWWHLNRIQDPGLLSQLKIMLSLCMYTRVTPVMDSNMALEIRQLRYVDPIRDFTLHLFFFFWLIVLVHIHPVHTHTLNHGNVWKTRDFSALLASCPFSVEFPPWFFNGKKVMSFVIAECLFLWDIPVWLYYCIRFARQGFCSKGLLQGPEDSQWTGMQVPNL